MHLINTIATTAMLLTVCVCLSSLFKKDTQKSLYFNFLAIAALLYLLGNFLAVTNLSAEASLVGAKVSFFGMPFIPTLWYLCVREYCGKPVENTYTLFVLAIAPVAIVFFAQTWETNRILFSGVNFATNGQSSQLALAPGPLNDIRKIYQVCINLLGIYTIAVQYLKGTQRFKKQAFFFLISALIPAFSTGTFAMRMYGLDVDITPYGLAISLLLFFFALQHYGMQNFSSIVKDNVVENMKEGIILFDKAGIYMHSNRAVQTLFPEIRNVPVGTSIQEMPYLPFDEAVLSDKKENLKEFSHTYGNHIKTYSLSISPVRFKNALIGYSINIYNITPFKNIMMQLETQAHVDELTGAHNRRYLFERGALAIEQAKLVQQPVSLIMFDLDFFKKLNDAHGHPYGDYVLKTVALVCSQDLRRTDFLARYGGEEFCMLLLDTSLDGARIKAEAVRNKIASHTFEQGDIRTPVTASFGVSTLDLCADDTLETLIKRADDNLYSAKATGRNKVV